MEEGVAYQRIFKDYSMKTRIFFLILNYITARHKRTDMSLYHISYAGAATKPQGLIWILLSFGLFECNKLEFTGVFMQRVTVESDHAQ